MRYLFRFERNEVRGRFNRDRLVLAAMQNKNQLYFMMDTQFDGIYETDAAERRREYGDNVVRYKHTNNNSGLSLTDDELEAMLRELSRQKTAVFRKGIEVYLEIDSKEVVPGDMLFLSSGDIIPADVRIVYEKDLYVDQYIFTGNKEKIKKSDMLKDYSCSMYSIADIPDICLMGSRVAGGMAKAVAIGTGSATYLGKLVYGY